MAQEAVRHKKIHRFIGGFSVRGQQATIDDPATVHQVRTVLKLRVGEKVMLVDSRGGEYLSRLTAFGETTVTAEVLEAGQPAGEAAAGVILYCSIIKKENFELVVQKATEIGVSAIVPLLSRRTVKLGVRGDRLLKIAKEAAEQSGRNAPPEIREPMALEQAMDQAAANGRNLFFDASGGPVGQLVGPGAGKTLGVFIGPEGGWDENEIAAARERGFDVISLGRLVLRAETAAIVASYLGCRSTD